MNNIENKPKMDSIQALRALAFLGVFTSHARLNSQLGAWGVSVFFVLSGFLMTRNYLFKDLQCGIWYNVKFSWNKIKKLYLLHIIMMFFAIYYDYYRFGLDVSNLSYKIWVGRWMSNMFLVQSWVPSFLWYGAFNGVAWFLSAMAFLYFCFPYIQKIQKQYKNVYCSLFTIVVTYLIMIGTAISLRNVNFLGTYPDKSYWIAYTCPLMRLGDFIIGCNLGYLFVEKKNMGNKWISSGIEAITFILIYISAIIYSSQTIMIGHNWCRYTILWIPTSMAIVWIFAENNGLMSKLLTNKFFIWIGDISSYAFLIHWIAIQFGTALLSRILNSSLLNDFIDNNFFETNNYTRIAAVWCLALTFLLSEIWRKLTKSNKNESNNNFIMQSKSFD